MHACEVVRRGAAQCRFPGDRYDKQVDNTKVVIVRLLTLSRDEGPREGASMTWPTSPNPPQAAGASGVSCLTARRCSRLWQLVGLAAAEARPTQVLAQGASFKDYAAPLAMPSARRAYSTNRCSPRRAPTGRPSRSRCSCGWRSPSRLATNRRRQTNHLTYLGLCARSGFAPASARAPAAECTPVRRRRSKIGSAAAFNVDGQEHSALTR